MPYYREDLDGYKSFLQGSVWKTGDPWLGRKSGSLCTAAPLQESGLEIGTNTVANATNIFSLATKNSSLVAKVATRFLYDLDLN